MPAAPAAIFHPAAPPGLDRQILLGDGLRRRQLPSVSSWVGVVGTVSAASRSAVLRPAFAGCRRLSGGWLHPQQRADGDAEDPAHGDEVFQLRHGGVGLPLADRLPGDAQPFPQGLLRESGSLAARLDAAAPAYPVFPCASPPLPSVSQRAAEPATTGGFPFVNGWLHFFQHTIPLGTLKSLKADFPG